MNTKTTDKGLVIAVPDFAKVRREPVVFTNQATGLKLAGIVYYPTGMQADEKRPAVLTTGPMLAVKELAQSLYAQLLAEQGFITMVFDYSTLGSSEGAPRGLEDPFMKADDIKSAVTFLSELPNVDANRIAALGICGSGVYMPYAATLDSRIKSLISVVPFAIIDSIRTGSDEEILALKTQYEQTGEAARLNLMPKDSEGGAYYFDADRGAAANMIDPVAWSQLAWQRFHPTEIVKDLTTPYLVITSENAFTKQGAQEMYANAGSAVKELVEVKTASHFDMYDVAEYVAQNIQSVGSFLHKTL